VSLPCPVDGCTGTRSATQAFCRDHWYALPVSMRAEITRSWRVRLEARGARLNVREARSAHLEALERAEAFLEDREPNPRIWGGE
jgi:hypothetical protein